MILSRPPDDVSHYSALAANALGAVIASPENGVMALSFSKATDFIADNPVFVCNAPLMARYMGLSFLPYFDVLELFAFVRPAENCVPTIAGLADAVGLERPKAGLENEAQTLEDIVRKLLSEVSKPQYRYAKGAYRILKNMAAADWSWGPLLLAHLPQVESREKAPWQDLSEWEDAPPSLPPDDFPVAQNDVEERLQRLLGDDSEQRHDQVNYARSAVHAFMPREHQEAPNALLLEAGTGIGKTLGYIAPASLWAEKNNGPVWLSTYTKNLQKQIDQELDRLFSKEKVKAQKVVIRKGRENYLCLLNLEESLNKSDGSVGAHLMGLVLRWVQFSRDGDMVGGDFPSWLSGHFGNRLSQLTDRRGECVYSACSHYRRCFIEKARRRAKDAQLVVANHALVMFESLTRGEEYDFSKRIVFDEGHHLFDAADSAFSLHLSGLEARELRSWIRGKEKKGTGRARGLRNRIDDLIADDHQALELLDEIFEAALCLPDDGWLQRLASGVGLGPTEEFLVLVRAHVLTRAGDGSFHDLEAATNDPIEGLIEAAQMLNKALLSLAKPMGALVARVKRLMDEKAEDFSTSDRARLEAVVQSLARRAEMIMQGWAAMVNAIGAEPEQGFVDWFAIARNERREYDVGLYRHYLDPTLPFSKTVLERAHGVIITSATLRDKSSAEKGGDWLSADVRSGAGHLIIPPRRFSYHSPFDYAANSKVIVVTDVNRNEARQVAGAYRSLFEAAGGGAMGLFTAISRLRTIYNLIAKPLEEKGYRVGAQHVDPMDVATLVDIFRDDPTSCLLGTDALRDGVDVPGESLKLIVFDRVPWPRPSILHKARRAAFGGSQYDDLVTRLRMKQAFGRLIRKKDDRGIFVILDSRTPSRLLDAFPADTEVVRTGLKDAVAMTSGFFTASQ